MGTAKRVRYLVIGGSGQVGHHLLRALLEQHQDALGTAASHSVPGLVPLDIRDRASVLSLVSESRPDVVLLAAACTNVDSCEVDPPSAHIVNVLGAKYVADAVGGIGSRLVFFSSDYVFDGRAGPYSEDDATSPISEYGRQKVMAEELVALNAPDHLIIRTTVVYGWEPQGRNFVQRLVTSLREGKTAKVPGDQVGTPTYAPNLAEASLELSRLKLCGIIHVAGPAAASRYEFAVRAAQVFGLDPSLVESVPTASLKQLANRPLQAGLRTKKAATILKTKLLTYGEGLETMAREAISPS
jgi:dTDP-4-dehydrorhamnose reductase